MSVTLSPAEVVDAAGGYKRPAEQLRELHRRGFYRAYRSKVTGEVVLERPHYDAVHNGTYVNGPICDISSVFRSAEIAIEARKRRKPSAPMDWQARTALYRHFDRKGRLLYIGIAVDPAKRESAHRCYSPWRDKIHRIEVEWLDDRHAARAAERAAIAAERPKFNILHTGRP